MAGIHSAAAGVSTVIVRRACRLHADAVAAHTVLTPAVITAGAVLSWFTDVVPAASQTVIVIECRAACWTAPIGVLACLTLGCHQTDCKEEKEDYTPLFCYVHWAMF